jgi:hypothetical protein
MKFFNFLKELFKTSKKEVEVVEVETKVEEPVVEVETKVEEPVVESSKPKKPRKPRAKKN